MVPGPARRRPGPAAAGGGTRPARRRGARCSTLRRPSRSTRRAIRLVTSRPAPAPWRVRSRARHRPAPDPHDRRPPLRPQRGASAQARHTAWDFPGSPVVADGSLATVRPVSELSTGREPALAGLLDTGLISGQLESTWLLRPERAARPVAVDDLEAAVAEISWLCQVWGGAGQPLLPVIDGQCPAPYFSRLEREQLDGVGGLQDLPVSLPWRVSETSAADHPAILIAGHVPIEQWQPVEVVELAPEDPWAPTYAAVHASGRSSTRDRTQ